MSTSIVIMVGLALVMVIAVLGIGIFSMIKGGEFNKKYGNKLMQLRVLLQGLALALLALAYFSSQS